MRRRILLGMENTMYSHRWMLVMGTRLRQLSRRNGEGRVDRKRDYGYEGARLKVHWSSPIGS